MPGLYWDFEVWLTAVGLLAILCFFLEWRHRKNKKNEKEN